MDRKIVIMYHEISFSQALPVQLSAVDIGALELY